MSDKVKELVEKAIDEAAFKMCLNAASDEDYAREHWERRPEYEVKAYYRQQVRKALEGFASILSLALVDEDAIRECADEDGVIREYKTTRYILLTEVLKKICA